METLKNTDKDPFAILYPEKTMEVYSIHPCCELQIYINQTIEF